MTAVYDTLTVNCIAYASNLRRVLDGFAALKLLLGQADKGLQPAIAANMLQLAKALQQHSLSASLEMYLPRRPFNPKEPFVIFDTQQWMASSDDNSTHVSCKVMQIAMEMLDSLLCNSHQYGISCNGASVADASQDSAFLDTFSNIEITSAFCKQNLLHTDPIQICHLHCTVLCAHLQVWMPCTSEQ